MFELRTVAIRADGCFSVFLYAGRPFAVTCERTFPAPGGIERPVIAAGVHRCRKDFFHRGGYASYSITVPGHSLVKFHRGSLETDSDACVLVAENFAVINGLTAIRDSKAGFDEFMRLADGVPEFDLVVSGR